MGTSFMMQRNRRDFDVIPEDREDLLECREMIEVAILQFGNLLLRNSQFSGQGSLRKTSANPRADNDFRHLQFLLIQFLEFSKRGMAALLLQVLFHALEHM